MIERILAVVSTWPYSKSRTFIMSSATSRERRRRRGVLVRNDLRIYHDLPWLSQDSPYYPLVIYLYNSLLKPDQYYSITRDLKVERRGRKVLPRFVLDKVSFANPTLNQPSCLLHSVTVKHTPLTAIESPNAQSVKTE